MTKLTEKQRRFVEAYLGKACGNATEAARIAGYSGDDDTLSSTGYENLRKPQIQEAIDERTDEDPLVADRIDRQRFWTGVMYDPNATMSDRLKASTLLAKSQGDFVDRTITEHKGEVTYKLDVPWEKGDDAESL
ncbi:terminase small subunit [Persicimonas caeni]|uniref:Terminase small subunit n=1 Tax=Persicimonas caeni TaxID=2292766 RepID=A0A4Y6PM29_PERCE|nr:terminase small subunit [Persicimonas caeni]QDG49310.1 terminase small subunit [Persicimonas caeni]QED30531.1 terminase small subunit [Persicimonas caeni]